jgi:hypothetical protein
MDECMDECMDEWMCSSKIIFSGAHYPPPPFSPDNKTITWCFPPFTVNKHLQKHDFMVMSIISLSSPINEGVLLGPICVRVR